jgi:PAS domain S-box-containing protein
MKDKDKTAQKKSRSKRAPGAKGTSSARRTGTTIKARFQAVFEGSRDAIGVSKAGIHIFVNPAYLDLFGFPRGTDLAGKPVLDRIAPGNRDQVREYTLRRARGESAPSTYETRGLRIDGSEFDMEVNVTTYQEDGEDRTLVILRDITQRKAAEKEIAERGALLQQIMDTADVAIFLVDRSGRIIHANRRMAEMFNCALEEIEGSEYVEHVHPSERETGRQKMLALLASKIPSVDLERLYRRKDGTEFWGHLAGRRFHDAKGNELGLIGVITDISESEQAKKKLLESESHLRTVTENAPDAILLVNRQGTITYINRPMPGLTMGQIIGSSVYQWVPKEQHPVVKRALEAVFDTGQRQEYETEGPGPFGDVRIYNVRVMPVVIEGKTDSATYIATDITERKRSELALKQSEEKYRRLYNETPILLHSIDRNRTVVEVNDYWLKTMGYERDEVIGRKVTDFYTEASRKYAQEVTHPAFFQHGFAKDISYQFVKKNGDIVDVLISATAERDAAGNVVRSQAVIEDITERKRAEEALRENQARLDLALQSAHMGVWRWEIKENRRYFDDLTCQLLGIEAATFTGTPEEFFQVVHPEDREKIKAALARTIEQDVHYEPTYRVVWPDGSVHDITARGRLVRDDKGQPARINGVLWDITGQRLLEDERLKTQKLESIGTLAGGIAHDFNNLLQGVFGFISMAKLTFDQKEKSLAMLTQAEKALHQSVNLTSQLLTFSKGGKPVKKVFALRPLIENSVAFALSGSRITYEIVIDKGLRPVEADEGQIGQVIQNIVLNADQAMPLGGMIRVSARNMPAAAMVPPVGLQGDLVEISIRDQGAGIPPEHLTRIFDPYFTTKEKGSGLGLATVYSIIKNHGGLVRVQSEAGKGTTFFIYLPASRAEAEEPGSPASPTATRKGRVLVMDDEEIIRAVAGELLTALGHDVAFAQTGEEALETYRAARETGRPFDVVILDLTIRGGMGGMDALRKLMEIDPKVKAVVSSGYSDDVALTNYREQGFRAFLKKPYNVEDLRKTLDSLLE